MKKTNKNDTLNLIFSAFLVVGYIICSYFFLSMSSQNESFTPYINALVFTVFGLILFYATRVGEGKPVKRFSLPTLIILDIPALYAILAGLFDKLPLHSQIASLGESAALPYSPLFIFACIALGYGIPYTFLSGYETKDSDTENDDNNEMTDCFADCSEECNCDCDCCDGCLGGVYVLCDSDTDGALLVVDDMDYEYNPETEIRISDVSVCSGEVKVGSFVYFADAVTDEEFDSIEKEFDEFKNEISE